MKRLFSFSNDEPKQYNENIDKVELVNCPLNEMMCKVHLSEVKKSYLQSDKFRKVKNFDGSIDSLKNAFYKATELVDLPCSKCAKQYRSNIIKSLINIHGELKELSTGFFRDKTYVSSFKSADNTLKEFEISNNCNSIQPNESTLQFLGNYLN